MESDKNRPVLFGKYQILEELGRGGFGIVYRAFDTVLEVDRAIKELYPNLINDPAFVNRFKQEARIAARLDHPNLVPVHDFGQIDGKYYLSMGYMPGGSLKDLLKREGKLEPQAAYELLEQVVAALSYAHSKGIIHRDLKPGNILFDENGKARVADMGFAKVMSEGASRSMSASGSLVGTPAYMAPETWRNKPATPQTDIYSLGCILYEMLTGKVLFEGDSPAEVITKHVVDGPQYAEDLPQDLRSVLDKALKREPDERYLDTKDLLADFKAMLRAEKKDPVLNFPNEKKPEKEPVVQETTLETEPEDRNQIERASPRKEELKPKHQSEKIKNPVVIGLVGFGAFICLIFLIVWFSKNQQKTALPAATATARATEAIIAMVTEETTTTVVAEEASSSTAISPARATSTSLPTETLIQSQLIELASTEINASNVEQVEELEQLNMYKEAVPGIAWSPDGKQLAFSSYENNVMLWDTKIGEISRTLEGHSDWVVSVAWSPDGKRLASASWDHKVIIWDVDTGEKLGILEEHTAKVRCVSWSPDGKRLASGGDDWNVLIWDMNSGERLQTLRGHTEGIRSVAWSPDGKRLASGSFDNTIIIWDLDLDRLLRTLEGHTSFIKSIDWSPDGKYLASGSYDYTIILWNANSGQQLHKLELYANEPDAVAWSPDGKLLAVGNQYSIILYDADMGTVLRTLKGHLHFISSIVWSPDGKMITSTGWDGTIRFWGIP